MKIQCGCGEWFEDSFIAEWGGVCSTCKAEADLKANKEPVATVLCSDRVMRKADCHTQCYDCGQFLKKHLWVPKDHRWKKHALCLNCLSQYDDPEEF